MDIQRAKTVLQAISEATAAVKTPKTAIGKRLASAFPRADVDQLVVLENAVKSASSHKTVDAALDLANKVLDGHGVESIEGDWHDRYYQNIVLLYVNQGDTYSTTLCYDTVKEKFFAGSYGDWVERYGDKLGVS